MCTIVFLFLFLNRNYNIEYAIVYYLCVCMRKNILELIIQVVQSAKGEQFCEKALA